MRNLLIILTILILTSACGVKYSISNCFSDDNKMCVMEYDFYVRQIHLCKDVDDCNNYMDKMILNDKEEK